MYYLNTPYTLLNYINNRVFYDFLWQISITKQHLMSSLKLISSLS